MPETIAGRRWLVKLGFRDPNADVKSEVPNSVSNLREPRQD